MTGQKHSAAASSLTANVKMDTRRVVTNFVCLSRTWHVGITINPRHFNLVEFKLHATAFNRPTPPAPTKVCLSLGKLGSFAAISVILSVKRRSFFDLGRWSREISALHYRSYYSTRFNCSVITLQGRFDDFEPWDFDHFGFIRSRGRVNVETRLSVSIISVRWHDTVVNTYNEAMFPSLRGVSSRSNVAHRLTRAGFPFCLTRFDLRHVADDAIASWRTIHCLVGVAGGQQSWSTLDLTQPVEVSLGSSFLEIRTSPA